MSQEMPRNAFDHQVVPNAYRFVCILIALTYVLELVFLNHFLSCDTSHLPARGSRADVLYSSESLQEKASLS